MRCQVAIVAVLCCASLAAHAQTEAPPTSIDWQLQVLRNGQTIDTFQSTTAIGQAYTATHHHETVHDVGCKDMPAAKIDLVRTLTVSPVSADTNGITLAIEADDTIEDDIGQRTIEGCALPPQPRRITASHPGLRVQGDEWVNWTIVDHDPTLVYRVHASVVPH
jgi:hypothetical protein